MIYLFFVPYAQKLIRYGIVSDRTRLSPRVYVCTEKTGMTFFSERIEIFQVLAGTSIGMHRLSDHVRPERKTTISVRRKIQIQIRTLIVHVIASTDT